jgi:serine/threonine protein kinase
MKKKFGLPLILPPFRGRIQAEYIHPLFLQAISDCKRLLEEKKAEILLEGRNRVAVVVGLPRADETKADIVIKEFHSVGVNRLKSAFVSGKAFKSWQGACALVEKGIETPAPVAYLEERKGLFLEQSFFLAERIEGAQEIRFIFRELPSSELRRLLAGLSRHLSFCHKQGVLHHDLSDGNILVGKDERGDFRFYLLDTNRIRLKDRIGLLKKVKNLIRLGIPPELQRYFLEQYLGKSRAKRFLWLWYRINKTAYTQFVELKKKLRLRKLSRKLKIQ